MTSRAQDSVDLNAYLLEMWTMSRSLGSSVRWGLLILAREKGL